jgi:hypothetical protein
MVPIFFALIACKPDAGSGKYSDGGGDTPADPGSTTTWSFDEAPEMPDGIDVVEGTWAVDADSDATSPPNVFRQSGEGTYPRILIRDLVYGDVELSVRCRPETGSVDQACGLLFRAVDSDNYLVTRANALEDNVRLYTVVDGNRVEFASADLEVSAQEWHTLAVALVGDRITVRWDDAVVLDETDTTFREPGNIGVWTKADSVTAFDDLTATAAN